MVVTSAQTVDIPSAKHQRHRRAKDTTKQVLEPGMFILNELVGFILVFEKYKQSWHVQELRRVLEEAQEDLRSMPMPAYWGLTKFADLGEVELTEEDAEKVVEDVQELWKDVAVTVPAVLKLKVRSFHYPFLRSLPKHATLLIVLTERKIADSET